MGESRPDGLVEAVVKARRRRRVNVVSSSSSSSCSGRSDGVTLATSHLSHLRSDIFYIMREVFITELN